MLYLSSSFIKLICVLPLPQKGSRKLIARGKSNKAEIINMQRKASMVTVTAKAYFEYLLHARHSSKCFMCMNSSKPHSLIRKGLLTPSFYRWENGGIEGAR